VPPLFIAVRGILAVIMLSGCAATAPFDAFQSDEEAFRRDVRTVAVMPMRPIAGGPDREDLRRMLEATLVDRLERLGFTVVAPDVIEPIARRIREEVGKLYDPITGTPNTDRIEEAEARITSAVASSFRVDALLRSRVVVVKAPFSYGRADWGHTVQFFESEDSRTLEWLSGTVRSGAVPATALAVEISSPDGQPHYSDMGGIEVLLTLDTNGWHEKKPADRFQDAHRNGRAVDLALLALTHVPPGPPPPEKPKPLEGNVR
jgi:hypothetical protein